MQKIAEQGEQRRSDPLSWTRAQRDRSTASAAYLRSLPNQIFRCTIGQYTTVNGHMYVSSAITDLERRATVIGTSGWSTETRELTNVPTATRRLAHEAAFEDTVEKFMERYQQPHEVSEHN
mmetsp:Transcript_11070/g.33958  ORF Transcript_11070/g.33958 Transcript_11070/m.33958 type:complete len:121 (-) Transcript_11070:498-860(-)